MGKKEYKQNIRIDAKTATIKAHLEDILIEGFLEVASVTAEQTKGGEARPDFLRCIELDAAMTAERLTAEVRRRQAERGQNKVEIETIKFVEDHVEVTATYKGMSLPITVSARVNACLDEYGCITVNLLPLDGALGWLPLPLAKIAAQAARQDRKIAEMMIIREIDNDSIRLALRMDRTAVILPNLRSIDISEGKLHIRCLDCSQQENNMPPLVSIDELDEPTLSPVSCACALCQKEKTSKEVPTTDVAEKENEGWLSSLSSIYQRVVSTNEDGSLPQQGGDCQRQVEDFVLLEKYSQALQRCEKELDNPSLRRRDERRLLRRQLLILLEGQKDGAKAEEIAKEAIDKFPDEAHFHELLARSYDVQGRSADGVKYLEERADSVQESNHPGLASRFLGAAATMCLSDADSVRKAESLLPAIETLGGKGPLVAHLKGEFARKRGDLALASQWFEQALNQMPFRVDTLRCLGRTLAARHHPLAARAVWSTILLLRPYDGEACRSLGIAPGSPTNRADDFTPLDEKHLSAILNWTSGVDGARVSAAQNLVEKLAPAIPLFVDEKPLLPHGSQSIAPKEEQELSRAFSYAKSLLPPSEGIIIYRLPNHHHQIISGNRWVGFPVTQLKGLDHQALVFLSLRELVRQERAWPRLDEAPIVPSLLTCLTRRIAAEGIQAEEDEGFINDVITSHIGADGVGLHDRDLDLWIGPQRRDEIRNVCSRFVSMRCNPCDINNVISAYEWTLDRVALIAIGDLVTAAHAITASSFDEHERAEARRIGPLRLLLELIEKEKQNPTKRLQKLQKLCSRLVQLCRFARRVDNLTPKKPEEEK